MKTKFYDFINESNINFNKQLLTKKISDLKKWLVTDSQYDKSESLGLMHIIDSILDNYVVNISEEEIQKFKHGLEILDKTSFPKWFIKSKMQERIPNGIENAKLIKIDDQWSFVNKLNTNYYDLSDLLVFIIEQMISDKNGQVRSFGEEVYNTIINEDAKKGLMMLKTKEGEEKGLRLKNIITRYITDLPGFLNFTKNSVNTSRSGEISENKIRDFLLKCQFTIEYQGGNGDFIDMFFGCDLIVYRKDYGYKTVQIKNYMTKQDDIRYYKVDWLGVYDQTWIPRPIIKDLKTFKDLTNSL